MSAGLGGFAKDMTTKFTLPVLGVVAVAVNGAKKIDDAYRTISRGTGQLGKPLDDLKKAFDDTFKKVPEDAQTVAGAIVQIHDKLGLVGTQLSTVTGQMLEFATATGNALDPSTVANYFQRWKIGAKEMAPMLDALARLSQATGVSGQSIIQQATTNAPALQQGGFSANQGAALIAYLQQSGGKSQAVLSGFQRIETNAQKFGLDPKKVVADLMQALKDGTGNLASDMAQMSKSGSLAKVGGNAPGSAGALAQDKIAGLIAQENALLAKGTAVAPLDVARISQEEVIKQKIRDKAASQNRPLTAAETVQINQADTIITKLDAAATPKGLNAAQQAQLATIKDTIAKDSGGRAASTTNQQAIAALLGPRGALEAQTTLGATGQQKYQALITTETKGPTIEQMAASTRSFSEQMKILGHNVDEALKPLGMWLITAGTDIAGYLIPIVQTLSGWFSGLPSIIKTGFAGLMIGGAVIGPVLLGIGKVMSVFDNMGKTVGKISDVVAGLIPGGAQAVGAGAGAGAQAAASGMTATDKGLAVAGGVQGVSSAETIVKDTPGARDAKRLLTGKPTTAITKVVPGLGSSAEAVAPAVAGVAGAGATGADAVAVGALTAEEGALLAEDALLIPETAALDVALGGEAVAAGVAAGATTALDVAAVPVAVTLGSIVGTVALVVAAIVAAGIVIYEMVTHWKGLRTAAVEAWAWIKQAASDAWKFLQPILSSIGSFIVNVVVAGFKMLVRDVPPIFAAIEGAVVSAWNTISPILMTLGGALVTGVSAAWRGVSSAVSAVVSAVTTGWRDVKSASEDTWKVVSAVVRDAWAVVEPVLRFMAMIVRDVVLAAWFILRQEVAGVWFIVSHVIGAAWAVISPILSTLANVVGTVVVGAFHVLASAVGGIWGGISAGAGAAWSVLSPVFSAIAGAVGVALPAAFGFLERLGAGIWSGLTSIATTVWPVLRPILAAIGDAVSVGIVPTLQNLQSIAASVFSAIGSALATAWGVIWPILKLIGEIVLIAVIGPFVLLERAVTGTVRVIAGILQYLWTGIIGPIFRFIVAVIKDTLIVQFYILRDAVAGVFAVVGWLIGAAWRDVIKPVFGFIVDAIKVGVIQQFHLLQDVVSAVFAAVGWVIAAAWNDVIKPVFGFIVNVLTTVLTSAFRGFQLVVGTVWAGIQTVIGVAWDIIKAIFGAVVDALTLVLAPAFSAAQVLIGLAWAGIQTLVQTGWDIIKTVFGAIETYLVGPAVDMWNTFAGALSAVWSALPDALSSVWDTIQGIFFAGVNAVISVLNGFITVLDLIPGVSIKPIGLVHQTAAARPAANTGAVGSKGGFFAGGITSGPALVGEGGPAPEYVIPTDPKYRSRALGLWAGVGAKIGAPGMKGGGIVGAVTGAVGDAAGAVAGAVSNVVQNVAQVAAKPGEEAALLAANALPVMWRGMTKNVITSIYNALTGAGSSGGPAGGMPPGQAADWIRQGMALGGAPDSWFGGISNLAKFESGYNAKAINLTDSNAAAGHPCVPLDSRILTREGWKTHDEVRVGDETIGYNTATGRSEWTEITEVHHYESAPVWEIGNRYWRVRTTPNHRWWSEPYKMRSGRFVTTAGLKTNDRLRLAARADTDGIPGLSLEDVAVIAWLQGDGHIRPVWAKPTICPECGWAPGGRKASRGPVVQPANSVAVHRAKRHGMTKAVTIATESGGYDGSIYQSKPEMLVKIRALLARVPHSDRLRTARAEHHLPSYVFCLRREYVTDLMKRSELMERGPEDFVLALSPDQRSSWLGAMDDAEGHTEDNFTRIAQVDGPMQNAIRLAVYLEGFRPTYSALSAEKRGFQPSGMVGMAGPYVAPAMFKEPVVLEDQAVWCVSTTLGTWTMLQGGRVMLTGNSKGIMQMIDSTFLAHMISGHGDIWNPVDNVASAIGYIRGRYGDVYHTPGELSLARGGRYVGYDKGGVLPPGLTMAMNTTGHNEYVTSGLAAAHELGPAARHFIEAMAAGIAAAQERNAPSPAQANREYHITVHNPVAETAEESIGHQMSRLAYLGVAG